MAGKAPPTIDVVVLGVSHRTAPVALREKLTVPPEQMDATLLELKTLPGVREVALLSTCNRVEIYAVTSDADTALRAMSVDLARRAGMLEAEIEPHLYTRLEREGVKHLFRVAASLDSLVVGEPQILGQVKTMFDTAGRLGTVGAVLNGCAQGASRAARLVRSKTEIARNPVSISSVAVDYAHNIFGDFQGKHVLVVGAGKMSDLAARALRSRGATLTVTNRTRARAEELAARFGAGVHDWEDLAGALAQADIVIASTGAQRPVLTRELLARVQKGRRGRSIFLIDIAVPRDVEPSVTDIGGVYVADIDDLQKKAAESLATRQVEASQAEAIVEAEVTRFLQSWSGGQLGPTVTAMRTHVIGLAHTEADKLLASLARLEEKEKKAIVAAFDAFAKKVLHLPQMALKKDAGEAVSLVDAVRKLFDLQPAEPVPGTETSEASSVAASAAVAAKAPGVEDEPS
jgi:glutamyl-tRNA reductase